MFVHMFNNFSPLAAAVASSIDRQGRNLEGKVKSLAKEERKSEDVQGKKHFHPTLICTRMSFSKNRMLYLDTCGAQSKSVRIQILEMRKRKLLESKGTSEVFFVIS